MVAGDLACESPKSIFSGLEAPKQISEAPKPISVKSEAPEEKTLAGS